MERKVMNGLDAIRANNANDYTNLYKDFLRSGSDYYPEERIVPIKEGEIPPEGILRKIEKVLVLPARHKPEQNEKKQNVPDCRCICVFSVCDADDRLALCSYNR